MKTSAKIKTHQVKIAEFEVFGQNFQYELCISDKSTKIKPADIVPILSRELVEARYETDRKDDKKVILFYKKSNLYGHISFKFAVEADSHLQSLMTDHHSDEKIPEMISYMFDKQEELNFNI